MIDHKFDTLRSRDPDARQERGQAARRGTGDSLAEPMAAATIGIALHAQPTEGFPG